MSVIRRNGFTAGSRCPLQSRRVRPFISLQWLTKETELNHMCNPRRFIGKSFGIFVLFLPGGILRAQSIVVDAAPSHAVNSFSPVTSLGGAIDRLRGGPTKEDNEKNTERLLTNPVLNEMLGAGWQTVTYRQNTELMIEAWHWNARGTFSNPAKQEGYFVGSPEPTDQKIMHSWAYPLPHRGATLGDGNGWSRLTDGNLQSYWKSNPYLARPFTGEDDSKHRQWVMIDLGSKVNVNAIRIAWANPYATRYVVQFWTGELEPFYEGINKGTWQAFPMGTIDDGKGGTPTLKLMNWQIPVRYLRIWMTDSSNTCDTHGHSLRYQARMVSGLATEATCSSARRPIRLATSARVARCALVKGTRAGKWERRILFSAIRHSFCSKSCWFTKPVTYANNQRARIF